MISLPAVAGSDRVEAPIEAGERWVLCGSWRHREWDGEHVIYSEASGNTHQVTAEGLAVLEALGQGPASAEDLVARLGGDPSSGDAVIWMVGTLTTFARLGLVEHPGP